jgi:hypothetical protein
MCNLPSFSYADNEILYSFRILQWRIIASITGASMMLD